MYNNNPNQTIIEKTKQIKKTAQTIKIIWTILPVVAPILFLLFFVVLAGGAELGDVGSTANGVTYEAEYNFENTTVTVLGVTSDDTPKILATVSLEDYIIGVACVEIGACDGTVEQMSPEYIKTQFVASKTYVLKRGNYNSTSKSIEVKASTRDQQWCDLETGCMISDETETVFHNSYPGDYPKDDVVGAVYQVRTFTEEDLENLHLYYEETYGELFLPITYNDVFTTLSVDATIAYKSSTQNYWKNQAESGKKYQDILVSTGTANVADSEYYKDKKIYRLSDYVKQVNLGSSGLEYAEGDMTFLSGGLKIPIYYQQDYPDVIFRQCVNKKGKSITKTVKSSGCGFTSASMIVSYLLDKKITPRELVDDWSRKYYICFEGMSYGLPNATANHYNLGEVIETESATKMLEALKEGHPVMSSQSEGLFTNGGHLIVLRGVSANGKILVNDPNKNNATNKGYNTREFTLEEIDKANKKYFIWPKKET